jgi:dihydroxyacid dehydratase/phosphogluconate dehydratase
MKAETSADPFDGLDVPDALQESLDRHRGNLAKLISTLHSAGVSDDQIEFSVSTIVFSYKQELLRAIKAMVR